MSHTRTPEHPAHGSLGYLQLPARDLAASATFYEAVFGWTCELTYCSFEAPGLIGQFTTERSPAADGGPVLWICVDELWPALREVTDRGGAVVGLPQLDQGERWLAEVDDPAGNRLGLVVGVPAPRPQPLIAVTDVEASSRWYQEVLGLESDHGGREYERLLSGGRLVLQLHDRGTEHHHGLVGAPGPVGNGSLLWFGEVGDFDDVVTRVERIGATVVRAPHRNPPSGQGNGPSHREIWFTDPDGYTVVVASPDGEAYELP